MSNKNKQNPMNPQPTKEDLEHEADNTAVQALTKNRDVVTTALVNLHLSDYVTVDSLKTRCAELLKARVHSLLGKLAKKSDVDPEFSDFLSQLKPLGSAAEVTSRAGLLQYRINTWSTQNFGDNIAKSGPIYLQHIGPLLGVAEELAEYGGSDADGYADLADALADAAIYLLDYAARTGAIINITQERYHDVLAESLLTRFEALDAESNPIKDILVPLGKLIHINLKAVQGIRGYNIGNAVQGIRGYNIGNEKFQADNAKYVNEVFLGLSQACTFTLIPLAEFVFNRVEKRNWVTNPEQAHVAADSN